jgi:hypothetical protein
VKNPELPSFVLMKSAEFSQKFAQLAVNYTERQIFRLSEEFSQNERAGMFVNHTQLFNWAKCLMELDVIQNALTHLNQYNGHAQHKNIEACKKVLNEKKIRLQSQEIKFRPKPLSETDRAIELHLKIAVLKQISSFLAHGTPLATSDKAVEKIKKQTLYLIEQYHVEKRHISIQQQASELIKSVMDSVYSIKAELKAICTPKTLTEQLGSHMPDEEDVKGLPKAWHYQVPEGEPALLFPAASKEELAPSQAEKHTGCEQLISLEDLLLHIVRADTPLTKILHHKREFSLKSQCTTIAGYSTLLKACQAKDVSSLSALTDFAPVMQLETFNAGHFTAEDMVQNASIFKYSTCFKTAVSNALRNLIDNESKRYMEETLIQYRCVKQEILPGDGFGAGVTYLWQESRRTKAYESYVAISAKVDALEQAAKVLHLYDNPRELLDRMFAMLRSNGFEVQPSKKEPAPRGNPECVLDVLSEMLNSHNPMYSCLWHHQNSFDQRDPSIIVHLKELEAAVNDPTKWRLQEDGTIKLALASKVFQALEVEEAHQQKGFDI